MPSIKENTLNVPVQWARLISIRSRVTKWYTLELAIITESNAINFAWRAGRKHTISTYYSGAATDGRIHSKLRINCAGVNFISLYAAGINREMENAIKNYCISAWVLVFHLYVNWRLSSPGDAVSHATCQRLWPPSANETLNWSYSYQCDLCHPIPYVRGNCDTYFTKFALHLSQMRRLDYRTILLSWVLNNLDKEALTSERITRTNIQRRQAIHNHKAHIHRHSHAMHKYAQVHQDRAPDPGSSPGRPSAKNSRSPPITRPKSDLVFILHVQSES